MLRISILALFTAAAFAQDAQEALNKPPEEVDKALRSRITEFFQYHIDKQFRKAEPLVAEDTKEFFYVQNKPHYLSCEIRRIDYSENFTHAKATMVCEAMVPIPGFTDPVKAPFPSTWKIEDGKWCWYVDPELLSASPMGRMTPGPPSKGAMPPMPGDDASIHDNVDFLFSLVRADKTSVSVKAGDSETVTVANTAPGVMNISLVGSIPGVEAKLEKTSLAAKEKATLTIHAGEGAKSGTLSIRVEPLNQMIQIDVNVK